MSSPRAHWPVPRVRPGTRPSPVVLRCNHAKGGIDGESLVQYVLCARVDLLAERGADKDGNWEPLKTEALSRRKMGELLRFGENYNWTQLHHVPKRKLSDVTDLEDRLTAFAHSERGMSAETVRTMGWLTAFATEMLPGRPDPAGAILGRWFPDLSQRGPVGNAEAIVLGEALLGQLAGTSHEAAQALWDHNRERAELTARALVAVATRPPGGGAMAAVQLGAQLGVEILDVVGRHLECSPVGFRSMRFVQRIFHLAAEPPGWWSKNAASETDAARSKLRFAHHHSSSFPDPYPARSFFLEAVRASLDPHFPDGPWRAEAVGMIRGRLDDPTRPGRERAYAAHALWELGVLAPSLERIGGVASTTGRRALLGALFSAARPGALTELLLDPIALGSLGCPEIDRVNRTLAAESVVPVASRSSNGRSGPPPSLGYIARLPSAIQEATAALVRIALLSPDGTARGRACDALREALVTDEAVGVISAVVTDRDCEPWLQEIGAFVLGQLGNRGARTVLVELAGDPSRVPAVRHAALWALGDLRFSDDVSVLDVAERTMVESLAPPSGSSPSFDVLAAAVYALGVTDAAGDRSGLLQFVASPSYRATPAGAAAPTCVPLLARWGLITRERIARRTIDVADRLLWGAGPTDLESLGAI